MAAPASSGHGGGMHVLVLGEARHLAENWAREAVARLLAPRRGGPAARVSVVARVSVAAPARERARRALELQLAKLAHDAAGRLRVELADGDERTERAVQEAAEERTICVAVGGDGDGDEGDHDGGDKGGLGPLLRLPFAPGRRLVLVLAGAAARRAQSVTAALEALRTSRGLDFAVVRAAAVVNGAETTRLGVAASNATWPPHHVAPQRCVTHADLARVVVACCRRDGARSGAAREDTMHRLCRTPRVHLDVYSYGVSPETAQTVKYDPRMSRMRETYGPVLLKAPFSRWGGLKAAEARTSAASFARRDQRQPSHALVRPLGNLMPLDLKQENHRENLLGKIQ